MQPPNEPSSRSDYFGALTAALLVLFFGAILLWRNPEFFWIDDYQISILPVFADVARSWSEGHWPLLSPYSWVCANLAGEFQYGTFSLFINAAIVVIWKLPLAFAGQAAAMSLLHLCVLGTGGFFLARQHRLTNSLAIMVALVAALNGWIIYWGAMDWFGALAAFAWLPWTWWSMERALDPARSKFRFLWPAPFVYLLVTGGFPYTVLMLGLLAAWLSLKSLGETKRLLSLWPLALGFSLGVALAAPAWLALLDYVRDSARSEIENSGAHSQWLVPPAALPGFFWPGWTVGWTNFSNQLFSRPAVELACGTVPPVALVGGLIFLRGQFVRRMKWELGLLLVVLIIAMLPSANVFRWSFRWLPLLHLVLALVGAEALAQFGLMRSWRWAAVTFVFASLLATYLVFPTNNNVPKFPIQAGLTNAAPLDPARLYLSVFPPPETTDDVKNHPGPVGQLTRPGSTSMWAGVHLINGYSPIRGAGVGKDFAFYTHGEIDLGMADYLLLDQAGPNEQLALLGIDGIIVAHELNYRPQPATEWKLVHEDDEGRVFHRVGAPLAAVRTLPSSPNEKLSDAKIRLLENSRPRVQAEVNVVGKNPARLIFSRPFFDGYCASINGRKIRVESYRGLAPTVELAPGTSGRLVLDYRPRWLPLGGAIAAVAGVFILFSLFLFCLAKSRRGRAELIR